MKNEILNELWQSKDEISLEYTYDIKKLAESLKRKEKKSNIKIVDLRKR